MDSAESKTKTEEEARLRAAVISEAATNQKEEEEEEEGDHTVQVTGRDAFSTQSGLKGMNASSMLQGQIFAERYEIIELIGKGGSGTVYKVRHLHLDKMFALKILHASGAENEEDTALRFQQEAKLGTRLDHAGIVRVHDFGVFDGKSFMIMDLLTGESLSQLIKKQALTEERLVRIFAQILNALSYAHEKSVIHRDIKPNNVLIHQDENGEDQVTLVDLGIAKLLSAQDMNLTKTGEIFGTPLYMSPEQCLGQAVDARSDIYSVGCVLYEVLAGTPPFRGATVFEIINKHVSEAPPPVPQANKRGRATARLEAIVLKALAKDKIDRYQFALEMASDLKQIEHAQAGVLADMKVAYKLFAGRNKAVQRSAALWSWAAGTLSIFSVIIASLLFVIQPELGTTHREFKRNAEILFDLPGMIIADDPSAAELVTANEEKIRHLKVLTKKDRKQYRLLAKLSKEHRDASTETAKVVKLVRESMRSPSLESLTSLNSAFRKFGKVSRGWTNASITRAELYGITFNQYSDAKNKLSLLLQIIPWLRWIGVACDLVLISLLVYRFKEKRDTRKAYKAAAGTSAPAEQSNCLS